MNALARFGYLSLWCVASSSMALAASNVDEVDPFG